MRHPLVWFVIASLWISSFTAAQRTPSSHAGGGGTGIASGGHGAVSPHPQGGNAKATQGKQAPGKPASGKPAPGKPTVSKSVRPQGQGPLVNRRIPQPIFRARFGRNHASRITFYNGFFRYERRFWFGGYWFCMYQPWPLCWGIYDMMYVDYVGGAYYLYDPYCNGPGIIVYIF